MSTIQSTETNPFLQKKADNQQSLLDIKQQISKLTNETIDLKSAVSKIQHNSFDSRMSPMITRLSMTKDKTNSNHKCIRFSFGALPLLAGLYIGHKWL